MKLKYYSPSLKNKIRYGDSDRLFFQYYRCILLVPDIYNRQHIKEVVNMLLLNMGFSGITDTNTHTCMAYSG